MQVLSHIAEYYILTVGPPWAEDTQATLNIHQRTALFACSTVFTSVIEGLVVIIVKYAMDF